MRPQPRRRPITRKDYAQGQGRTASLPVSLSLVSPRLSSAPPRLARVRSDSASKRHETLRQIRNAEIYMRARSNMLRICVTIQHWCVRGCPCDAAAAAAAAAAATAVTKLSTRTNCQLELRSTFGARGLLDMPNSMTSLGRRRSSRSTERERELPKKITCHGRHNFDQIWRKNI